MIIDLNECASNPCLNGGACKGAVNGYTCECCAGFTGELCETGNYIIHYYENSLSIDNWNYDDMYREQLAWLCNI